MSIFDFKFWGAYEHNAELLEMLTLAACPAPCIGVRDPDGMDWHATCEERARKALKELRGWVQIS